MSDLLRSVPFEVSRADETSDDGLTLEGYAAVFDTFTRIDSWEGTFDEQIRKGAFRKTIRENTPVLQFDHGAHPLIGSIPIGTIESLSEDDQGLAVTARLSDNWLVQPVRDAIASGAVSGMSFRFQVVREEWRDADGKLMRNPDEIMSRLYNSDPDAPPLQRTITELRMAELGPVVFPAYKETSVGVRARSLADQIKNDKRNRTRARRDLAFGQRDVFADEVPEHLVADVARALLFDAPGVEDVESTDAPVEIDHPSEIRNDAPLIEEHPSEEVTPISRDMRNRIKRDAAYRTDYLTLIMKGANRYGD